MPNSKYDARDIVKHIAEGRHEEVMRERAAFRAPAPQYPTWLRFVVLDVIHDPTMVDSAKLSHYVHDLGVANPKYAVVAPRNSIIARRVMGPDSGASEKTMILYPACPPHLAMPAKPGEHVWGFFENPDAKVNDIGYWLWKITMPDFVEDVNYTHADRQYDASFLPGLSDVFDGTASPKYEFHNGAVDTDNDSGKTYVIQDTASIPGDDTQYTTLLDTAKGPDATRISQFESVPRYRKRPQDVAFEGTNNTLIVLGTDRTGAASDYTTDPQLGQVPKPVTTDQVGPGAGAIDMVAGRGQTDDTGGKPVTNTLGNKELGKDKQNLQTKEGDVDLINDRSRVLIAQKTKADTNLGTAPLLQTLTVAPEAPNPGDDSAGYGYIVVKTDKIRLIARQDVVILVTQDTGGSPPKDANGNLADPGANGTALDPDHCASIIVRSNGDIVFTPSKKGLVKLGGDGANLAVLCTSVVTTGVADGSGNVTASPIVDTMGGAQGGTDGLNGIFATKVLMK